MTLTPKSIFLFLLIIILLFMAGLCGLVFSGAYQTAREPYVTGLGARDSFPPGFVPNMPRPAHGPPGSGTNTKIMELR